MSSRGVLTNRDSIDSIDLGFTPSSISRSISSHLNPDVYFEGKPFYIYIQFKKLHKNLEVMSYKTM